MSRFQRILLKALPKLLVSRTMGLVGKIPLPRFLRGPVYRWYARRYGADLSEIDGELDEFRSFSQFFVRPLRAGTRPVGDAPIVWPCDGRVVTAGPVDGTKLEQIKGRDYDLGDLVVDGELAKALAGGTHATIYLAPGDYHRVHVPFDAEYLGHTHVPGKRYPVYPAAVRSIHPLFTINERVVFRFRLPDARAAAVVMVAALNVSDIQPSLAASGPVARGDELGRFGFGSTTVVLLAPGGPGIGELPRETVVRMGASAPVTAATRIA